MRKVAIIRCSTYDYSIVKSAVIRGIDLLGGVHSFSKPGETLLLKPNLLAADTPERASTTHHSVFKAVGEVFKSTETNLFYGDSPGFHSTAAVAQKNGIAKAAEELSIPPADFKSGTEVVFTEGIQNKKFTIADGVLEADGIISISKMKAHGLTRITGAIKNQFGCIPGALKGEFHARIPSLPEFSKMLVDLNLFLKPRLFIMDGIVAMEGNGPRGGNPKEMNVLLFSSDPVALDSVFCRLIGLSPDLVYTNVYGMAGGLGTYNSSEIELVGDDIAPLVKLDFDVNRDPLKIRKSGNFVKFIQNALVKKPYIIEDKCIKCGVCVNICPVNPKAINWSSESRTNPPKYNYSKCIRCYCCQEMCPEGVIKLKTPALRKLFGRSKK